MAISKIHTASIDSSALELGPIYVDSTNDRIGIGTTSPTGLLELNGGNLVLDHTTPQTIYKVSGTEKGYARLNNDVYEVNSLSGYNFKVNGFNKMSMDANGYVTKPGNPCFSAYHSGDIAWNGYTTPLVFNGVRFDTTNSFNTSTGQFTAPVSGKYLINCYLHFMGESSYTYIFSRMRVNGTSVGIEMMRTSARANYDVFGMSTILNVSANDTIDIFMGQSGVDSGFLRGGSSMNKFEGFLRG